MAVRAEWAAEGVGLITLDEPKARNALTAENRTQLVEVLDGMARDDTVRAAVLTGAEGNFCAGGDIRTMGETDPAKIEDRMNAVAAAAEAVAAFPKPLIAAVAGHAAGAGVSLACLCDTVIADESAQFTFSHLRLALCPDWGLTVTLGWRVGVTHAKHLILSHARIGAEEAYRIGLADVLTPKGEAVSTATARAGEFVNAPAAAIASIKAQLGRREALRRALAAETSQQLVRFTHPEHQEAANAFREKRDPDFTKKNGN